MLEQTAAGTANPLAVAASVVGILLSIPGLALLVKGVFFIGQAAKTLESVAANQSTISEEMKLIRQDRDHDRQESNMSFFLIETDMNALQEHNELPVRDYPDRRTGPVDRRRAGQ